MVLNSEIFNVWKYFEYYMNHTYNVVLAWKAIQDILLENEIINEDEFTKINMLIAWHDNSKINSDEFSAYGAKFFPVKEAKDIGSAEDFKLAWDVHKSKNLHHHQSLNNYTESDWKCYIVEMICDWIAMGFETDTSACKYYEQQRENIVLPDEYRMLLEKILSCINAADDDVYKKPNSKTEARLIFK